MIKRVSGIIHTAETLIRCKRQETRSIGRLKKSVQLAFSGAVLGIFEEAIKGSTVEVFSAEPDGLNLCGVVNVGERIGGEENEIGALPRSDKAEFFRAAEKFGRANGGGLQRGQGSEARFH